MSDPGTGVRKRFRPQIMPKEPAHAAHMQTKNQARQSGFTLAETMVSIMILGLVFAGTLLAYTRATQRAEWSGYSLAAQALCEKSLEQFHAVLWDTQVLPIHDDTTNIPLVSTSIMDIPISGTNVVWATNTATITSWTNAGPSYVKMINVKTTWWWNGRVFTNQLVTYRCPDQ